jgi:hypothetical protein
MVPIEGNEADWLPSTCPDLRTYAGLISLGTTMYITTQAVDDNLAGKTFSDLKHPFAPACTSNVEEPYRHLPSPQLTCSQ